MATTDIFLCINQLISYLNSSSIRLLHEVLFVACIHLPSPFVSVVLKAFNFLLDLLNNLLHSVLLISFQALL